MLGTIRWGLLAVLAAASLSIVLFALTAAGHFPQQHRSPILRTPLGMLLLWGTMATALAAAGTLIMATVGRLPWYATVIAAGLAVLMAPLCLQSLPDSFVDGRRGLLTLAIASAALAVLAFRL